MARLEGNVLRGRGSGILEGNFLRGRGQSNSNDRSSATNAGAGTLSACNAEVFCRYTLPTKEIKSAKMVREDEVVGVDGPDDSAELREVGREEIEDAVEDSAGRVAEQTHRELSSEHKEPRRVVGG
jgi:hypothetical protein